jgi:hypothetical protein
MSKNLGFRVIRILATLAVVTLAFEAASSGPWSDPGAAGRIARMGKNDNRSMEHLEALCNGIGARPAGSRSHQRAAEWAHERFREFGLSNVHLERCGEAVAHPDAEWVGGLLEKLSWKASFDVGDETVVQTMVPVYNVVGDIPGSETPDEYVIVGAHYDSVPIGTGALDNGTGVAAVMEAARLLVESGAKPKRTIRFVLFAGEESGLIGSRGYVESHPELLPKISAMYNMDLGTHYISGIQATEPLEDDMEAIFAPAKTLDPDLPFDVELTDWLLMGDPNCCVQGSAMAAGGEGGPRLITRAYRRTADGTLQPVELDAKDLEALGSCGTPSGGEPGERRIVISGGCVPGAGDGEPLTMDDLEDLGLVAGGREIEGPDGTKMKLLAIGSSDQSAFLAAGVPGFWWAQRGDSTVSYPAHSEEDRVDKVIPAYLGHSATVIALGALGTADLDHLLSREKLTKPRTGKGAEQASLAKD